MAGIRPLFVSAPKVRIKISQLTVAFAIGLSLSIDVNVENVFTFGQFDSAGPEPLHYGLVSGSIQIVKLNTIPSNSVLSLPPETPFAGPTPLPFSTDPSDGPGTPALRLADHLDPTRVLASETFDFDILVNHFSTTEIDSRLLGNPAYYSLYSIKDCRIGGSNINIALGALLNEPVSFQGLLLVDDDIPTADAEASDELVPEGN